MAATNKSFLPQQGAYKQLIVFKLATCIYALTYAFAHRYFSRGDRTIIKWYRLLAQVNRILPRGVWLLLLLAKWN